MTTSDQAIADRDRQRYEALQIGNAVRYQRADLKQHLKNLGRVPALEEAANLILNPPDYLEGMVALKLLEAIPGIARRKANAALTTAAASPLRTIGGLTDRQRHSLANHLKKLAAQAR
jgi:hypothetical protein